MSEHFLRIKLYKYKMQLCLENNSTSLEAKAQVFMSQELLTLG